MNTTARTRQLGLVTIVDITGPFVRGEECTLFAKLVDELLDKGHIRILVNLADVDRIDSAGLAYIIRALRSAQKRNGDLKLLNPRKDFENVLQITQMLSVLDTSHDEAAAIKSFVDSARGHSAG